MKSPPSHLVSASKPDWSREAVRKFWDPSRKLLWSIRRYQHWKSSSNPLAGFFYRYHVMQHRFWSVVTGAEIPINSKIGGGLMIPHPNGIVFHPDSKIGPNCLIFQQVTLAAGGGGAPSIGGHVDIGAGAKILGSVVIGDHARVGANAVVTKNVKSGVTVAGIPARPISTSSA